MSLRSSLTPTQPSLFEVNQDGGMSVFMVTASLCGRPRPTAPPNTPETAIHASYLPWLARVDALIGEPARLDLARHTSFLAAWREGLSPHEAVADAKARSMPRSPRWRMRWRQSA